MPTATRTAAPKADPAPLSVVPPAQEPYPPTLAEALAVLQTRLPKVGKSNTANVRSDKGNYSYKYADLADISDALLPELGRVGLSWTAAPTLADGRFVLAYALLHASGDTREGQYPLPATGTPQSMGSAITYARRYCLCSVTGLAPDADDDAAASRDDEQSYQDSYAGDPPARPERPPSGRNWVEEAKALDTEEAIVALGREAHAAGEFVGGIKVFLINRRGELARAAHEARGPQENGADAS